MNDLINDLFWFYTIKSRKSNCFITVPGHETRPLIYESLECAEKALLALKKLNASDFPDLKIIKMVEISE